MTEEFVYNNVESAIKDLKDLTNIILTKPHKELRKTIFERFKKSLEFADERLKDESFSLFFECDENYDKNLNGFAYVKPQLYKLIRTNYQTVELFKNCYDEQLSEIVSLLYELFCILQYKCVPIQDFIPVRIDMDDKLVSLVNHFHYSYFDNSEISYKNLTEYIRGIYITLLQAGKLNTAIDFYKKNKFAINSRIFVGVLATFISKDSIDALDYKTTKFISNEIESLKLFKENLNCNDYDSLSISNYAQAISLNNITIKLALVVYDLYTDYHFNPKPAYKINANTHIYDFIKDEFESDIEIDDYIKSNIDRFLGDITNKPLFEKILTKIYQKRKASILHFEDKYNISRSIKERVFYDFSTKDLRVDSTKNIITYDNENCFGTIILDLLKSTFDKVTELKSDDKTRIIWEHEYITYSTMNMFNNLMDVYNLMMEWNRNFDLNYEDLKDFIDAIDAHLEKLIDINISNTTKLILKNFNDDDIKYYCKEFLNRNEFENKKIYPKDIDAIYKKLDDFDEIKKIIATSEILSMPYKHITSDLINGDYTNIVACQIKLIERYLKEVILRCAIKHNFDLEENLNKKLYFVRHDDGKVSNRNYLNVKKDTNLSSITNNKSSTLKFEIGSCISLIANNKDYFLENPQQKSVFDLKNDIVVTSYFYKNWVSIVRNEYMHIKPIKSLKEANLIAKNTSYWFLMIVSQLNCF